MDHVESYRRNTSIEENLKLFDSLVKGIHIFIHISIHIHMFAHIRVLMIHTQILIHTYTHKYILTRIFLQVMRPRRRFVFAPR